MAQDVIVSAEQCVHHYIVESPNGKFSEGVCKKCGKKKQFANYIEFVYNSKKRRKRNKTDDLLENVVIDEPYNQESDNVYADGVLNR